MLTWLIGLVISGVATFYHPSLDGGVMRSNEIYHRWSPDVVAVTDINGEPLLPMGTKLNICADESGICRIGIVRDTGYFWNYRERRWNWQNLDLSEGLYEQFQFQYSTAITWEIIDDSQ
jgi:hypothetical protein